MQQQVCRLHEGADPVECLREWVRNRDQHAAGTGIGAVRDIIRRPAGGSVHVARVTRKCAGQRRAAGVRCHAGGAERYAVTLSGEELERRRDGERTVLPLHEQRGHVRRPERRVPARSDPAWERVERRVVRVRIEQLLYRRVPVGVRYRAGCRTRRVRRSAGVARRRGGLRRGPGNDAALVRRVGGAEAGVRVVVCDALIQRVHDRIAVRLGQVVDVAVRVRKREPGRETIAREVALIEFQLEPFGRLLPDI